MKRQEAIRFPGQKCRSFGTFLVLSSLVIILTAFGLPLLNAHSLSLSGWILSGSIALTAPGLFLWIWLNTHYRIDTPLLKINCGSLAWQIPIETITTIRLNQKTMGGMVKATLSWNSMEVRYKKYGSIFISPERPREFVELLKQYNQSIVVK